MLGKTLEFFFIHEWLILPTREDKILAKILYYAEVDVIQEIIGRRGIKQTKIKL